MIQKTHSRSQRLHRLLYWFTTASFLVPIVFLTLRLFGLGAPDISDQAYHSDADYALMLVECLLGLLVINLPTILARRLRFEVPTVLSVLYLIFLYCAIFLGEVRSFYYTIPHWDTWLHAFSSMMTGFFGVMVVGILNRDEHVSLRLSPFFVVLFAFAFSVMIGTIWEIYEFSLDGLLGFNMQKYAAQDGTVLLGHDALTDTMKDLMMDAVGALIAAVIGMFALRHEKTWFVPVLKEKAACDE